MNKLGLLAALLIGLTFPIAARGQSALLQSGPIAPGRAPMYVNTGTSQAVIQDSGPAAGGRPGVGLAEQLLSARGQGTPPYAGTGSGPFGTNWCDYDAPTNNPTGYHYLCMSPNAAGGALLAYGAVGSAPALPFAIKVNGTTYQFPIAGVQGPSSSVVGHVALWNNTTGNLLSDGGLLAAIATTGSASNLIAGTVPPARLPLPTVSTLGGVLSAIAPSGQCSSGITTGGAPAFIGCATSTSDYTTSGSITANGIAISLKSWFGEAPVGENPIV